MSEKAKKPQKLKARLPRGFVDRSAADIHATNEMIDKIRKVYELYGFDPVETPLFEYTDALGKFLPDSDRPNEGVFSLQDDDDQWMSLRYDLTAPLARHVAENFNEIQLPYRTYRAGYVFRNEKPGPGRFRQFMQFDADTVGAAGVQADAEMCMMMADTLEALGIARGDYVIRVNNRKVLDGVMEAIGLGGEENAGRRLNVLRAIDKLDKFGPEGVRLLLGPGRKDESGDFTKGAGLDDYAREKIMLLFTHNGDQSADYFAAMQPSDVLPSDALLTGGQSSLPLVIANPSFLDVFEQHFPDADLFREGLDELRKISSLVRAAGYGTQQIRITPSVVRGLEYYTGPVFEAELTKAIPNEKGEIVRFGSVGGGGRYDGLVSRFMGQPVPATGFSIGVSRLMTALKNLGKLGQVKPLAPVLITVMDGDVDSMGRYQRFTQALRAEGIRAEMYQGNWKKFGNQLKYADRLGSPIAIIQGGDERAEGVVQIKDLIEGKRLSGEIEDNASWREARVAQITAPEAELVAKVREILEHHAEDVRRAAEGH
ncbi:MULTISPECIES: histidine--tRNA ligase [Agrobacterium]|uniref:Histidine--tRNA ligase n=1 Tax=Agrobacterium tumefaciens TaxID=358 RepID=A0AAJ4TA66_AGRTU|nr:MULTISPECIES: histidine--tRNA ligase [Agrobacterium]MBO9107689.1 histidine--tRNA ligase [Agrobacterium sp. S2/73]MEA1841772.1 histidine--tRNA ligase [Agrobacterium tumefaciens]MRH98388.1 histidine--tRNA ligase [Agrobacterium tumefaciens]NTA14918.1 histidine--tRNA ligase [Agrobacterium tumefaciens]NTA41266.1 histidine--tRNA ligase [Agrobacterium tumefaciens]